MPSESPQIDFNSGIVTPSEGRIRQLADIPSIQTLDIPPVDFLVPGIIARNTITIWTGACGSGKSYLAMAMAVAVAAGAEFLGRRCQRAPVLYLDFENPAYAIKDRLELLCDSVLDDLHVWGNWNAQSPPMIGSELLLTIAKESGPLIVVDPLRFAHDAEENDSTAMAAIMQHLKFCAAAGCAVVAMHHPGKAEGSQSRGSSVIRDHADACLLHELNGETGLITLTWNKNRLGLDLTAVTIRPDFELGTFTITDSPAFTRRTEECAKVQAIITAQPGVTQNAIVKLSGGMKARVGRLLKEGVGSLWQVADGANRAKLYYPFGWFSPIRTTERTTEPPTDERVSGSGGSPLKGGEPPNHHPTRPHGASETPRTTTPTNGKGKEMPRCPVCQGSSLYREKDGTLTCQTCQPGAVN